MVLYEYSRVTFSLLLYLTSVSIARSQPPYGSTPESPPATISEPAGGYWALQSYGFTTSSMSSNYQIQLGEYGVWPFLSYEFNGRVVASFDSLNSAPPGPGVYVVTEYSRGAAIEGPYVTGRQIHSNYASWHHPVGAALYPGAIAQFTGTTVWQVVIEARRPVFVMDEGGGYHFIGYESWLIETAIETPRSAANYIYIP